MVPNMYDLMVSLTLYGTGIIWFPHMYNMIFSGQLLKRSTACPYYCPLYFNSSHVMVYPPQYMATYSLFLAKLQLAFVNCSVFALIQA